MLKFYKDIWQSESQGNCRETTNKYSFFESWTMIKGNTYRRNCHYILVYCCIILYWYNEFMQDVSSDT